MDHDGLAQNCIQSLRVTGWWILPALVSFVSRHRSVAICCFDLDVSTAIGCIAVTLGIHVHDRLRTNCNNLSDTSCNQKTCKNQQSVRLMLACCHTDRNYDCDHVKHYTCKHGHAIIKGRLACLQKCSAQSTAVYRLRELLPWLQILVSFMYDSFCRQPSQALVLWNW